MEGPHPGGTAFRITVSPVPGKYAYLGQFFILPPQHCKHIMVCKTLHINICWLSYIERNKSRRALEAFHTIRGEIVTFHFGIFKYHINSSLNVFIIK